MEDTRRRRQRQQRRPTSNSWRPTIVVGILSILLYFLHDAPRTANYDEFTQCIVTKFHVTPATRAYWREWGRLGHTALVDSGIALHSVGKFLHFMAVPLSVLAYTVFRYLVLEFVYTKLLLPLLLLSPHAMEQIREGAIRLWNYQRSLSWQYWAMECCMLVGVYGLRKLLQFLGRKRYKARFLRWMRVRKRHIQRRWTRCLQRLATVSVVLAIMTPHLAFVGFLVSLKMLLPQMIAWIATETALIQLVSLYFGCVYSILAAFDKPPPYAAPSLLDVFQDTVFDLQVARQFWTLYAARNVGVRLLAVLPWPSHAWVRLLASWATQFELFFWIWVHASKYLQFQTQHPAPVVLQTWIIRAVGRITENCTIVSQGTWASVVGKCRTLLEMGVYVKMLRTETVEFLLSVLEGSRGLVLPGLLQLLPGPTQTLGLVYVQYIFPLNRASVQFWVLQSLLVWIMGLLPRIVYWIPLFQLVVFCAFGILATANQAFVQHYYKIIESELQYFSILPPDDANHVVEESKLYRASQWILAKLPKAKEDDELVEEEHVIVDRPKEASVDDTVVVEDEKENFDTQQPVRRSRRRVTLRDRRA